MCVKAWLKYDASPFQFWYPRSGIIGGILFCLVVGGVVVAYEVIHWYSGIL